MPPAVALPLEKDERETGQLQKVKAPILEEKMKINKKMTTPKSQECETEMVAR